MLGFTLGFYAVRAMIEWFCLLTLDLDISYFAALAALAVGNLVSSIPSPASNVGLREGGMFGVLAGLRIADAPATIGALLFPRHYDYRGWSRPPTGYTGPLTVFAAGSALGENGDGLHPFNDQFSE